MPLWMGRGLGVTRRVPLADGPHTFTATATDVAGNASVVSLPVDPVVGTGTVIDSTGATSLTEIGNHFYLYDSTGAGPSMKIGGVGLCRWSIWCRGARSARSRRPAAMRLPGNWPAPTVYGVDHRQQRQLSVKYRCCVGHQRCVGITRDEFPPGSQRRRRDWYSPIDELAGATSLTEIGNHFYLYDSTGAGPSMKIGGVDYVDGQFGALEPDRRGADGQRL